MAASLESLIDAAQISMHMIAVRISAYEFKVKAKTLLAKNQHWFATQ